MVSQAWRAGRAFGAADASIVGPRTAPGTATDRPYRADRVNERTVGGMSADNQGLGKTVRMRRGGETAGLRRKDLVAASGCKQGDLSYPASRWANAGYNCRWRWTS